MWMNFSLRKSIFIRQLSPEWRPPRGKSLGLDSQNFSLQRAASAKKVAVVEAAAMVMVVLGGWAAGPWLILSLFLCVQVQCTMSPHQHIPLPVSVPLPLAFIFPDPPLQFFSQATEAVFQVACLTQLTKIAWILVSAPFLSPHILFSPHYSLTYLMGHMVKEILFGPFQTAKLADRKHSAPVTSREFGSLLKWSF